MTKLRVVSIALLAAAAATACTPPPEPPPEPTEWIPTETCIEPRVPGDGYAIVYHGPADTKFNTTGYLSGNGECVGSGLRLGNLVRATSEAAAIAKCEAILTDDIEVLGADQLSDQYDLPDDAWLCLWGVRQ